MPLRARDKVKVTMVPSVRQPELQNGDRMSRQEFLSRWECIPELRQAELIEGVVYLASPVSLAHGSYDALFVQWLGRYISAAEGGLSIATNTTLLWDDSTFQPDIALVKPALDQRSGSKYLEHLPELVVEIAYSSRSYDLGPKLEAYRSAGLQDYITVLLEEQRVEWRVLRGSRYRLLAATKDGLLRSPNVPGLWLDTGALFPPNAKRLFAAVDRGIQALGD
jgi:Uma2 family endonuclease